MTESEALAWIENYNEVVHHGESRDETVTYVVQKKVSKGRSSKGLR